MSINYYNLLDVGKAATQAEIKKAYRKKAHRLHPDKNGGDKEMEKEFILVQEAYEVLKDPEKRADYDQYGRREPGVKTTREGAIDSLVRLFTHTIDNSRSLETCDIKKAMCRNINANMVNIASQKVEQENKKIQYLKVVGRVKSKSPVYVNSINEKILTIDLTVKSIEGAMEVNEMMLEMLEADFEYLFDEERTTTEAITREPPSRNGFSYSW